MKVIERSDGQYVMISAKAEWVGRYLAVTHGPGLPVPWCSITHIPSGDSVLGSAIPSFELARHIAEDLDRFEEFSSDGLLDRSVQREPSDALRAAIDRWRDEVSDAIEAFLLSDVGTAGIEITERTERPN